MLLDVEEATGAPRLTTCDLFGPESRNGLFCGNNPVNESDPTGLGNKLDGSQSDGTQKYTPLGSHIPLAAGASVYSAGNFSSGYSSTNGWGSTSGSIGPVNGGSTGGDSLSMGWIMADGRDSESVPPVELERITVVGAQVTTLDAVIAALDAWAPWVRDHQVEVAGTVKANGEITVGPENRRSPTSSNPGPITANTAAIWHFHLPLKGTAPYQFSTGPFGSYGGDLVYLTQYPNLSQYVGVLNAPPGQFTIFGHAPDAPFFWVRLGPQPLPQPPKG